ncbi:MAG: DUF4129 domain-containing protein [Rufibacter sp.]
MPTLSAAAVASAQEPTVAQKLVVRTPDPQKLKELQETRDFLYRQDVRPDMSWWQRFWMRVGNFLNKIFSGTSYDGFWKYVLYAFAIGVTVFVILKLLQVDFVGLFGRKPAPMAMSYETYRENIHEIDFQAMIEEAEAQGDYKRAIRLYYLKTLKRLTDAGVIDWRPGKTNRSYVSEIKEQGVRASFGQVTSLFEYVWYGGSAIDEPRFAAVRQRFQEFDQKLTVRV